MTTQKLPRYIAHYHPLYGIEKGLLAIGVLLTVKIVLILFGFLQNYHFLFAPVAKTVKYFIIGDAILVLYGFIVVIAFFSKLKKIPHSL